MGGMPCAISEYVESKDFNNVAAAQYMLNDSYIADMTKYATPQETARTLAVWRCIPAQLAKENQKFQYKLIKSGARAHQYELALDWLTSAGMINKCTLAKEGSFPFAHMQIIAHSRPTWWTPGFCAQNSTSLPM